jgi:hypothetical protein
MQERRVLRCERLRCVHEADIEVRDTAAAARALLPGNVRAGQQFLVLLIFPASVQSISAEAAVKQFPPNKLLPRRPPLVASGCSLSHA